MSSDAKFSMPLIKTKVNLIKCLFDLSNEIKRLFPSRDVFKYSFDMLRENIEEK